MVLQTLPSPCTFVIEIDPLVVAVVIFAVIRSETGAFPLSTVIIEQYRPPVGKFVVGRCLADYTASSSKSRWVYSVPWLCRVSSRYGCALVPIQSRQFDDRRRLGLMDENETPEQAALRELEEETGYVGEEIIDSSTILAADPGYI